jgi:tetratricopeptide (TPR) repeat protein
MKTQESVATEAGVPSLNDLYDIAKSSDLQDWLLSNAVSLEALLSKWSESLSKNEFIRLVLLIGGCFKQRGEMNLAEVMYTLGLSQRGGDSQLPVVGEVYMQRADLYSRLGRWKEANADLDQCRKIYKYLDEPVALGRVESILGANYAARGKIKRAQAYIKRALHSFEQFDETLLAGVAHMNLGTVSCLLGDYDGSLSQYHRAKSHFEEAGDLARLAELHHKCGRVYLAKNALRDALHEFDLTGSLSREVGSKKLTALSKLGKANAYFQGGDLRASLQLANQSLESLSFHDDWLDLAEVYLLKGKIHREINKYEFSEWYFHTSLRINARLENLFGVAECYHQLGVLSKSRGRMEEARLSLKKSLDLFRKIGAAHEVQRVTAQLSNIGRASADEA